jgi:hypothetical protein
MQTANEARPMTNHTKDDEASVTEWKDCGDCGARFDHIRQRGACPHLNYDAKTTAMLILHRLHPTYALKHTHQFGEVSHEHHHYVHKGIEWGGAHRHPVLEARIGREERPDEREG